MVPQMNGYDVPAWWYDLRGVCLVVPCSYRSGVLRQIRFFARNMGATHLELAVGSGTLLAWMLRWRRWQRVAGPFWVLGIEQSPTMLAAAQRRFDGWIGQSMRLGDAAALPVADGSCQTVNAANCLHVFSDIDAALREIYRVLKPGGTLAANVLLYPRGWFQGLAQRVNRWGARTGILYTPYHQADVQRRLSDTGFLLVSECVVGNTYEVVVRKP
jgi:ubiquinone/menaquinone biosynthesis C-methylase UbiE